MDFFFIDFCKVHVYNFFYCYVIISLFWETYDFFTLQLAIWRLSVMIIRQFKSDDHFSPKMTSFTYLLGEKLRLTIVTSLLLVERDTNTISHTQQLNYYGTKSIIFSVWFEFVSRVRLIYYCLMFFFQSIVLVLNEASWNGALLEDIYLPVSLLFSCKKGRLAI